MEKDCRPWGYYEVLSDGPDHKVKRIVVYPGKRLSLQRHRLRAEHWYIIRGTGIITLNGQEIKVKPGQAVDITPFASHRIQNPDSQDLVFIEIQTGSYFGEDDIERIEDDFGRI
jgi:mannose-6-phosphate isomerase